MANYIIGLDIGIASVGWAVIENGKRIIDLGVRTFDKAETAKDGQSLNLIRRTARLTRRRLSRRAQRLRLTANFLVEQGLIKNVDELHRPLPKNNRKTAEHASPWQLRRDGLYRLLTPLELSKVIYHIIKHRGFYWTNSAEAESTENDAGKVKQGLKNTKEKMILSQSRTLGEMICKMYPNSPRNKGGSYEKSLHREGLEDELKEIFEAQKELGNLAVTNKLIEGIIGNGDKKSGLLWKQRSALTGENLLKMLGKCRFEKEQYRAPKSSFAAERHVWLTQLNNLRITNYTETRPLNENERNIILNMPYEQKSELTYKQIRNRLVKEGLWEDENKWKFVGLTEDKKKDPETAKLCKIDGWQKIKKAYIESDLKDEWDKITCEALTNSRSDILDQLAWILSVYKEDDEVKSHLNELLGNTNEKLIQNLLKIRFDKFSALSLKALNKILPYMNKGDLYNVACEKVEYNHSAQSQGHTEKQKYLPSLYSGRNKKGSMEFNDDLDVPKNPVVLRSINQTRRVLNALIKKYGSPSGVHIELARDLSKSFSERNEIKKLQKNNRDKNEQLRKKFKEIFKDEPKGQQLEKYRLYEEQSGMEQGGNFGIVNLLN